MRMNRFYILFLLLVIFNFVGLAQIKYKFPAVISNKSTIFLSQNINNSSIIKNSLILPHKRNNQDVKIGLTVGYIGTVGAIMIGHFSNVSERTTRNNVVYVSAIGLSTVAYLIFILTN